VTLSATGLISGSSGESGTYDFTVEIADSSDAVVPRDFSLEIIPPFLEFSEPVQHEFTVPGGFSTIGVVMWGGGGGSTRDAISGGAASVVAEVNVDAGQKLIV
jgi:hypothetical protein